MKKLWLIIPCLFIMFGYQNRKINAAVMEESSLIENNVANLESLYPTSHGQIECYPEQIKFWYDGSEASIIGEYLVHYEYQDYLYIMTKNEQIHLLKFKKATLQKETTLSSSLIINQMLIYNDYLYLIGHNETEGLIMTYSQDLKEVKQYHYGNGCHLKIKEAIQKQNNWYLACTKDAHATEPFQNVGNLGEEKTCLIKLNNRMQITDIKYFNQHQKQEQPLHLGLLGQKLTLLMQADNHFYYYQINENGETELIGECSDCDDAIVGYDGTLLKVEKQNHFCLCSNNESYIDKPWLRVVHYDLAGGYFNVYVVSDNDLIKYQFDEYHINLLNNFSVDYFHTDLNFDQNLNHLGVIDIASIVGDLEVYAEKGIALNIPGLYDVPLVIKRSGKENIKLATKVKIAPYVNIMDGAIYRPGVMLSFMGYAKLNGVVVTNGYYINSPGNYTLTISDNNTQLQVINFHVEEDYYARITPIVGGDYCIPAAADSYLDFKMSDAYVIEEVIMDQQPVPFMINNNLLKVLVSASPSYSLEEHTINKWRIGEEWYDIDCHFSVKTLKRVPIFEVTEGETKNLSLSVKIDDPEQTIKCISIKELKSGKESYNYLKNGILSLDGLKGLSGTVEVSILYDLGDGLTKSKRLISLDSTFKKNDLYQVSFVIASEKISEMRVAQTDKATKGVTNLVVCNENITSTYLAKDNSLNLVISIVATCIVIVAISVLILFKHRKKGKL